MARTSELTVLLRKEDRYAAIRRKEETVENNRHVVPSCSVGCRPAMGGLTGGGT